VFYFVQWFRLFWYGMFWISFVKSVNVHEFNIRLLCMLLDLLIHFRLFHSVRITKERIYIYSFLTCFLVFSWMSMDMSVGFIRLFMPVRLLRESLNIIYLLCDVSLFMILFSTALYIANASAVYIEHSGGSL